MIPVVKDYVLASDDMVAIDAVSAWLMGFDPMTDVDCIRIAHERGLGVGDVREIEVVGEDVSEVNFHFQVRYHFASRVGRLLWFTPLARIQSLFFKTPLVHAFIWGSSVYHDRYWWPVHGRRRMAEVATTPVGAALRGLRVTAAEATAACRVDLAGGAPGAVGVTVAIDRRAWCRVETGVPGVRIESKDTLRKAAGADLAEALQRGASPTVGRVLEAMGVRTGVRVVTQSRVPEGSGLGESAALAAAVAGALARVQGAGLDRDRIARVAGGAGASRTLRPLSGSATRPSAAACRPFTPRRRACGRRAWRSTRRASRSLSC